MPEMILRLKKHALKNKGWYILGFFGCFGCFFYIIGSVANFGVQTDDKRIIPSLMEGLGSLMLISGMSGGLIKILAVEGVFLNAIREVVFSEHGLKNLSREKVESIWQNSSQILFLENMKSDQEDEKIIKITEDVLKIYKQEMLKPPKKHENYFSADLDRNMVVSWHDKNKSIIKIDDWSRSIQIPFKHKEPLIMKNVISTLASTEEIQSMVETVSTKLISEGDDKLIPSEKISKDKKTVTILLKSEPKFKHEIIRERRWKLSLKSEPNIFAITPVIIKNMKLEIENKAEDLIVIVSRLGGEDKFQNIRGNKTVLFNEKSSMRLLAPLMPEQGYCVTFVKA